MTQNKCITNASRERSNTLKQFLTKHKMDFLLAGFYRTEYPC